MEEKKKGSPKTTPSFNTHDKVSNSFRHKQSVRKLFLSGGKYSARQINDHVGFNDARKVISDLRHKEGWNIRDIRQENGCKLYWLEQDERQTSIDWEGGSNE